MELRPLGATDLLVSPLGLGTVKLGRNTAVKYPDPFELPSDAEARRLLETAAEVGINLLDTAPAYGNSESRLGGLLRGQRDRWVLATKVGEDFDGARSAFDFTPEHTLASIDRSLQRLRTDRLDIILAHSDGNDLAAIGAGVMDALARARSAGKVRAIGFSAKTVKGARAALPLSDCLMLTLNPVETEMLPVVREAHAAGLGVLVKKSLRSGHLPEAGDPVAAALRCSLGEPGVSSVVIGTISPDHLRANADAAGRVLENSERG